MQNTSMVSFDGGSASKVDDITALPCRHKMADVLLWQRYDNNKMVAMRYYFLFIWTSLCASFLHELLFFLFPLDLHFCVSFS